LLGSESEESLSVCDSENELDDVLFLMLWWMVTVIKMILLKTLYGRT